MEPNMSLDQIAEVNSRVIEGSVPLILSNAKIYLKNPNRTDCYNITYKIFEIMEGSYEKLSNDIKEDKEAYSNLTTLKNLIPQYRNLLEKTLEQRERGTLIYLEEISSTIIGHERKFWKELMKSGAFDPNMGKVVSLEEYRKQNRK